MILGLSLAALGLTLLAYVLDFFTLGDVMPGVYRDANAPRVETPVGAYAFIGFVLLFGLVSSVEGFWRIRYQQSNKRLLAIMLVLGWVFIAAGMLAKATR